MEVYNFFQPGYYNLGYKYSLIKKKKVNPLTVIFYELDMKIK